MTKKKKYWFAPKTHTGWDKDNKAVTRRRKLLDATDKRKTIHDRYVEAARMIQALANVTKDKETAKKARADAVYFFKKAEKTSE